MANQFVGHMNGSQRNQTLITFDNGAQWHKIEAPTLDCVLVRWCYLIVNIIHTAYVCVYIDNFSFINNKSIIIIFKQIYNNLMGFVYCLCM